MNLEKLNTLSAICTDVMQRDQSRLQKRIRNLKTKLKNNPKIDANVFELLSADIEKSLKQRQRRAINLPEPQFPDDLPVSNQRADIAAAIAAHQVIIVAGETGSGKTTQLPKICLSLGRGVAGLIGCTQPRRIAARTIAMRIAHELSTPLGHAVGYKVRFSDRLSSDTYIKLMTDGILLAETQGDRFLEAYDTLIIDEAHERSLNIDFLLGYIKQLLPRRPDLRLIITSATIDTARFSAHFDNAPIVEVSGRTYPVEVRYRSLVGDEDEKDRDMIQGILGAVDEVSLSDREADILVFLASERDIRDTAEALHKHRLPNTEVLPLYARLSAGEQNRVFKPGNQRRIVLATNVAETSLTVPRIKVVIDPGLARISRYSIRHKVQRLPIEEISRSSADQRKGRCGRIAPGVCIRLYSGEDYDLRAKFTDPEILRTSLASVILQMLALRLGDINHFPFIDPPSTQMINDGFTLLAELEAVDDNRRLTDIGWQLSKMPIDPRIGRMILAAKSENCLHEVLIIASALSIPDPRSRPMDAQQAADTAQKRFNDERSDFLSYLKLWDFFQKNAKHLSQNKLRKLCNEHFLSYLRLREWQDIHQQLYTFIRTMGWQVNQVEAGYDEIHRTLLTGLLGNIAFKNEGDKSSKQAGSSQKSQKMASDEYLGARNIKLYVFPGSSLFKKRQKWIMAAELVETTRLYARCAAKINPDWIEKVAGDLCQHHYFEPHWEKRRAQVGAYENVMLYGLTIVAKRKVNYGPLDPKLSREIFIRQALVEGEYTCKAAFFQHNQELVTEIEALEHKSRRQDILVDEEQIYAFYDARIPEGIYSGKAFEKWLKKTQHETPKLLFLSHEDLMKHAGDSVTPQAFPDNLLICGVSLPLNYHFEPGHECDGVTVDIPLALLNQVSPLIFEWLVPGLLEEKIIALLRSLPKILRRSFVPVPDVAAEALNTLQKPVVTFREGGSFLEYPKQSLVDALTNYCHRRLGKPLPTDIWKMDILAPHLLMNFRLVDHQKDMSRDLIALQKKWGQYATKECQREVASQSGLERDKITRWDFGDLPSQISLTINEVVVPGYPTLIDQETSVALRVLDNHELAEQQFRAGLRRLFLLALPTKKLLKQMPIDHQLCLKYLKIGHSEQLKEDMLSAIVESIFLVAPLSTKQTEFEQRLASGRSRLIPTALEYATQLANVLEEYNRLTQQIQKLSNRSTVLPEIKQHLKHLIYEGFIKEISFKQLKHLPRYLKAVQLRLERLDHDPQKDAKKSAQIAPLWEAYWQRHAEGESTNPKLIEFRWMLEELRVSLFAPELKTAYPVSVQRLQKKLKNLTI